MPPEARLSITSSRPERRGNSGFTLIELLVAMAIGLFVVGAVLLAQLAMSKQNARSGDSSMRDNEARAAVDLITRDLGSAGFLLGKSNTPCQAVIAYNSTAPGVTGSAGYFALYPVWGMAGATGAKFPNVGSASAITMSYPATGSTNRSDVLFIQSTADGTQYSDTTAPTNTFAGSPSATPVSTGVLPLHTPILLTQYDMALVQSRSGNPTSSQMLCFRVPITTVTATGITSTNVAIGTQTGNQMPSNFYTGFSGQLPTFGYTGLSLTNFMLNQYVSVTDMGPQSGAITVGTATVYPQVTYAYYVDTATFQIGSNTVPTLVRAQINAMTDQVIGTPQAIAAGVVSFQVLYGVDPGNTGAVTAYQTAAQTFTSGTATFAPLSIRSIKIAVVTRSLYADPDPKFTSASPNASLPLQTWFNEPGFTNYAISGTETRNHFIAQQTEIAVRNTLRANVGSGVWTQ